MSLVFFDTEFTAWKGSWENGWSEPWQEKELVQIGAVKISDELEEIETFTVFIKPKKNPILSDYFVKLTGITNEQVSKEGKSFSEAIKEFVEFIGDSKFACYGFDNQVIQKNCHLHDDLTFLSFFDDGLDVRPWFIENGIAKNVNSGALASTLGLDIGIKQHNALDDSRSIAVSFKEFIKRGKKNFFI